MLTLVLQNVMFNHRLDAVAAPGSLALFDISISIVDISTLLKNIDIDIDIDMVILENIDINIDMHFLENIDIDINKDILENIG